MTNLSTILRFTTKTQGAAEARLRVTSRRVWSGLLLFFFAFGYAGVRSAFAQEAYHPVTVADFNHDGIPDVLIPSVDAPTATISLGTLTPGNLSPAATAVTLPSACTGPAQGSLVVGDFNGDGLADIAFFCGSSSGTGGVLLGNGDGTFAKAKTLNGVYSTTGVVGDFDHDGKLDLAVLGPNSISATTQGIQFFHGNGDGTFAAAVFTSFASTAAYSAPVAVDLNNDGYPDLALGSFTTGAPTLSIFGNNKNGTFGVLTQGVSAASVSVAVGTQGESTDTSILVANFFGVSGTDLAVPDTGTSPGFFVVKNTSSGTAFSLGTPTKSAFPALQGGAVGSFTGSGFSDLVAVDGTNLTVLTNDGTGNFASGYSSLTLGLPSTFFAVADANGDGYSDIYTSVTRSGNLLTVVNVVNGSATATSAPVSLSIGSKDISALWNGDANFNGSTAAGTEMVDGSAALLALTSDKNPSTAGNAVNFTVVATAAGGTKIPSGVVSLMDGTTVVATGTLDLTGVLHAPVNSLTAGTHPITAVYAGDTYFAGITSGVLSQVVNPAQQAVPVISWNTPDPITYGTPLGSAQLNAVAADANGTAVNGTFAYTPAAGTVLGAGSQTLSVTFTPSDLTAFTPATKTVTLTVNQATASISLSVLAGSGNVTTIAAGSVVRLVATVTTSNGAVPTGLVTFCEVMGSTCVDPSGQGAVALSSDGTATLRFTPGVGAHTYRAVFAGTGNVTTISSTSSALAVTAAYTTTTTIAASGTPGSYTLTGTVVGTGGAGAPSGQVSFLDTTNGNAVLAKADLGAPAVSYAFSAGLPITLAVSQNGNGVFATGDFNGDGKIDLIESSDNGLNVLLGNGDGTFTAAASQPSNVSAGQMAVGDFNGDGKVDVFVATNPAMVLLGNGDGTFRQVGAQSLDAPPSSVAVGDFNGDGILDIAETVTESNAVVILLGKGDGTFTYASGYGATGIQPQSITVGDFNGDGKLDIASANVNSADGNANTGNPTVTILLGKGDGSFTAQPGDLTVGGYTDQPLQIVSGDINGDGKTDLVISSSSGSPNHTTVLTVFLGNGTGGFTPAAGFDTGDSDLPTTIALKDFNGDGKQDLVVADFTNVSLRLSQGDGTFVAPVSVAGPKTNSRALALAVADFDGDGVPDIAVHNPAVENGSVFLSKRTETLTATATGVSAGGPGTHQVVASYAGDTGYAASVSGSTVLHGLLATTTITWKPTVTSVIYGMPLGSTVLDAVATDPTGAVIPGTFVYTPAAGTILPLGPQTLSVTFTPTDKIDYTTATASITVNVAPASPSVTLTGPSTTAPGSQPSVSLTITNPYPVPLTASFNLLFTAAVTPAVDDPSIQFANGGRNFSFTVAANSVTVPAIQLQAGTVAGTIMVPLTLTAQGVDVTPANLQPVTIVIPRAVPVVSTTTVTRSGSQLSVAIHGFSNTREVTTATFHFTAAPGATINTPDVTAPVTPLFTTWFDSTASDAFGSTFTYTQIFNVSDDAANIGSVQVTLTNSVGVSTSQTAQ